jgi:hypothetical protein
VENNVFRQVDSPLQMLFQEGCVDAGVFFGGIGIQVGANHFEVVQYLFGIAAFGGFKQQMLNEMGEPVFALSLIARASVNNEAAMCY